MEFQNPQLDTTMLPSSQHVVYEKLDPAYRKVSIYFTSFVFAVLLTIYLMAGLFIDELYQFPWILIFSIIWSVFMGIFMILAIKGYEYEGYAIREKDILYKSGIFFRSTLIIPFNRVQHCEIEQGPIDRFFRLSELSLFTAGGSGSDLCIPGLGEEKAAALKNFITNKVAQDEEE